MYDILFLNIDHSTLSRFSGVSTKVGTYSLCSAFSPPVTNSFNSLCCFGPSCWIISGRRSFIVLVSGSPDTINVLFWIEAYASGLWKWSTVLSSLKKLI